MTRRMRDSADLPRSARRTMNWTVTEFMRSRSLWITAADGFFVKLRLSLRSEVADELEDARDQILVELAEAFAERPARPASATAAPQPDSSMAVDPANDPAEAQLWVAYASELLKAAREAPGGMPPCGGPLRAHVCNRAGGARWRVARVPGARCVGPFGLFRRAGTHRGRRIPRRIRVALPARTSTPTRHRPWGSISPPSKFSGSRNSRRTSSRPART